eukprot:8639399-Alexandrium_andersonii.AAC.1
METAKRPVLGGSPGPASRAANSGTSSGFRRCHLKARPTARLAQTEGMPGCRARHQTALRANC